MIRKIIFTTYFSEFYHKVAVKFRFIKVLQRNVFNPTLYLDTDIADKSMETPYVGWLVVLGLTALWDNISVYIGPSPKEREKEEKG